MKHFGDITKLNGAGLPVVDVITGGSPCQDLSIAGQRKGLSGERSGLFMEQIRIIKEMRENDRASGRADEHIRPRYMVWENVPGAFSSNKGEDFRAVLEETAKIADENTVIPRPTGGRWTSSGCIMGNGWSIAWRVHDAQFWGVPQRRRRIALVADFGGQSAPEILFERKGLSGDFEPGGTEREEASGAVGSGIKKASKCLNPWDVQSKHIQPQDGIAEALYSGECRGGGGESYVMVLNDQGGQQISISENQTGTLRAEEHGYRPLVYCLQGNGIDRADTAGCNGKGWRENESYTLNTVDRPAVAYSFDSLSSNSMKSKNPNSGCREAEVSKTLDCFDPNPSKNQGGIAVVQSVYDARGNGDGNICPTITGDHENRITDYTAITYQKTTGTLSPGAHPGSYNGQDAYNDMLVTVGSLCTRDYKGVGNQFVNEGKVFVGINSVVRRLTPLECERLQGYPDGWTDIGEWVDSKGKKHKEADSPRYKALGNSIALPFWHWMAQRICNLYDRQVTMGSLFDGIAGFCLVFKRVGAEPLWVSEIEEFPIAVCKAHFGDEDANIEGDIEKYL